MARRCAVFLATALLAQDPTFRSTVPVVLVPVSATDHQGNHIDGLTASDFILLDDGEPKQIHLDTSDTTTMPIAIVVAVQANDTAATAVLKIEKVGSLLQPLITGERGSAAVLAYGAELNLIQDFTSETGRITEAFRNIRTQSDRTARTLDAVVEAAHLLERRPTNERRVLLVISESRDRGSKVKLADAISLIQRDGIMVYTAVFSAYLTPFTTKGSDMPPPQGGGSFLSAITELARKGKVNAADAFANYSGGRKLSFATLRGLEGVVTRVGEDLHSQYLLSYPVASAPAGFHRIEVKVPSRPDAMIHARSGYWVE